MNLLLGSFIFCSLPIFAWSQAPTKDKVILFRDLPKLVRDKNENVQAADLSVQAFKERTGSLTRSFLPKVSAMAGNEELKAGSSDDRQNYWKVEARMNLYRGGRDSLEDQIRSSRWSSAQNLRQLEFNSELKEARQVYWKIVAGEKILKDFQEALSKNEINLRSAIKRAGAGVTTAADAVQFELNRTLLNQDLKKQTLDLDLLRNRLSVALGLDSHETIQVESEFPHPDEDKIAVADLKPNENIEINSLKNREATEKLVSDQAGRWWLPKVDIYASYGIPSLKDEYTRALRRETEYYGGVMVGIVLGEGFDSRNESNARLLESRALEKRKSHKLRELTANDHELRHDMKLLHELIHDADKDIDKSARFVKLTETEYARGVKNGPDLLEAVRNHFEFRQKRYQLYREYFETKAELQSLVAENGDS